MIGISTTLIIIVTVIVILVAALVVITVFSGGIEGIQKIISEWLGQANVKIKLPEGSPCKTNAACLSNNCLGGKCQPAVMSPGGVSPLSPIR